MGSGNAGARVDNTNKFWTGGMVLVMALVTLGMLARDLFGIPINKYIFLTLYIIAFVVFNYKQIAILLTFSIALLYGLPNTYILIIGSIALLYKGRNVLNFRLYLIPLILIAQELVLMLSYTTVDMADELAFLSTLIIFATLLQMDGSMAKETVLSYVIGVTAAFVIVILSTGNAVGFPSLFAGNVRLGYEAASPAGGVSVPSAGVSLRFNPNEVAYFSITALSAALLLLVRTGVNKILLVVCSAVCIVAGVLSQSRTWIIVVAFLALLQLVTSIRSAKMARRTFMAIGIFVACAAIFLVNNPGVQDQILGRFENGNLMTAGGRTEIMNEYNDYLVHNDGRLVFGSGVVGYRDVSGISSSTHNGIQQLIVCYGLFGSLLFIGLVAFSVARAQKGREVVAVCWIPLITTLLFLQSVQLINPWLLMLPLVCAIQAVCLSERRPDDGGGNVRTSDFPMASAPRAVWD